MADVTPAPVDATPEAAPQASPDAAPVAAPAQAMINIMNPEGELVSIPQEMHAEALKQNYRATTPADIDAYVKKQAYGGAGQQAITGLEGAAQGAIPLVTNAVETGLGLTTPEDIAGRAEINPWTHGVGQAAGLIGSTVIPGIGLGNILEHAGQAASSAAGLGSMTVGAKVGSAAIKGAVENALFQSNDEVERYFSNQADPNHPVQSAVVDTLGAGLIGGALGGALGGAGQLWDATVGKKVGGVLGALRDRLGGTEGEAPIVDSAASKLGVKLSPEAAAITSGNPETRNMGFALAQSPSGSGIKLADTLSKDRAALANSMAETLNGTPETLKGEWSEAGAGHNVAQALIEDNDAHTGDIIKGFEDRKAKYASAELPTSAADKADAFAKIHADLQEHLDTHSEALSSASDKLQKWQTDNEANVNALRDLKAKQQSIEASYQKLAENDITLGGKTVAQGSPQRLKINEAWGKNQDAQGKLLDKISAAGDAPGADIPELQAKVNEFKGKIKENSARAAAPGARESLSNKIGTAAMEQGWMRDPDIAPHIKGVMEGLGSMKTVGDLQNEMSRIGSKASDIYKSLNGNKQTAHALTSIKNIMRGEEENIVGNAIGSEEGANAYAEYVKGRSDFHNLANVQQLVEDRLRAGGSVSRYSDAVAAMAKDNSEAVWRRLNGVGDSALLKHLEVAYPKTAAAVREAHQASILAKAARAAKEVHGDSINPNTVMTEMKKLTGKYPELRDFAFPKAVQDRLGLASEALNKLKDPNYNYSNTGRLVNKTIADAAGSVAGTAAAMTGHGYIASGLIGHIAKLLSKDAPDAVRLAMLKFLGSDKPVNAAGFNATVNFMSSTMKGENAIKGAVGSLFKAGGKVIPASLIASSRDNDRLEKHLDTLQKNPSQMLQNADNNSLASYMPGHAEAQTQAAGNVSNYLASIRPKPIQNSPLDPKYPPSPIAEAKWQNALTIANQPLTLVQKIKDGNLTSDDMKHGTAMYPALMKNLQNKITAEIAQAQDKGTTIPYRTRQSMSLFMAQPLDSTMTPNSIMAAQSANQPTPPPQQQGGPKPGRNKTDTAKLGKSNSLYKTPLQASETQDTDRS
jgi:hypothetical protein